MSQSFYRYTARFSAILICLGLSSCFRGYDPAKIKCSDKSHCPAGYDCVRPTDQPQKICMLGVVDGGNAAGDAKLDGLRDVNGEPSDARRDGAGGTTDTRRDGAGGTTGGASSVIDAPVGGSISDGGSSGDNTGGLGGAGTGGDTGGGIDAPVGSGGSTGGSVSTGGATSSTGGTTANPDALKPVDTVLDRGAPCTSNVQCASNYCVDGVCCDGKCEGNCESCSVTGSVGTCSFNATARKTCGGTGACVGSCKAPNSKTCTFPDDTTICGAQSCKDGVRTDKALCDGKGGCPTQTKTPCSGNLCKADGSDCAACTDEASTVTCSGGHCGPTVNNCSNTVQCPTTCTGTGQTCGGAGVTGMCGCTPATTSVTCGSSNCGTAVNNCGTQVSCGSCSGTATCVNGTCCTPNCDGKCGGSNGCGGTCPNNCSAPQTCGGGGTPNVCGCTPNCDGKCGGSNGCGGTCPNNCSAPQTCGGGGTPNVCGCTPNCTGKCTGGSDGCNGTCSNSCTGNAICQTGTCQSCGSLTACSNTCVNTQTEATHCGNCTTNCTGTSTPLCSGGQCVECTSSTQCGGGGRICNSSGQCACPTGQTWCSNVSSCVNLKTDPNHCGSCTTKCSANKVCTDNGSTGVCLCSVPLACGGCGTWNFESNTAENWWAPGWGPSYSGGNGATGTINASSTASLQDTLPGGGSYALRVPITTNGDTVVNGYIQVPLCAGTAVNLNGATISASVYLAGPQLGTWSGVGIGTPNSLNGTTMGTANRWFTVTSTISGTQVADVAINLGVNGATDGAWSGVMWVDNVRITGN